MQSDNDRWSRAALRISSDKLSIEDICLKINVQPTRWSEKGEPCSKKNPSSMTREVSSWLLESNVSNQESLQSHIKYILSFLNENAENIKELYEECWLDVICAYASENGQGGFTLDQETLMELAPFPLNLSIDLYPPTCDADFES